MTAGERLRTLREGLGLTIRDVECASARIAQKHKNEAFAISLSRLSDIETKGIVPSIYRLYSLAVIYRCGLFDLLSWFGIELGEAAADFTLTEIPKSHLVGTLTALSAVELPVKLDPALDLRRTTNLGRMIERWGLVPLAYLQRLANTDYTYGYIGTEDFTMYPILLPGSFIQVDESKNKVSERMWRSEYERPIYFVETRDGYSCSWCTIKGDQLILHPHPLSPVQPRMLRNQFEGEVVGQVVGVAMRIGDWSLPGNEKGPRVLKQPN